jgi:hypothetical protein
LSWLTFRVFRIGPANTATRLHPERKFLDSPVNRKNHSPLRATIELHQENQNTKTNSRPSVFLESRKMHQVQMRLKMLDDVECGAVQPSITGGGAAGWIAHEPAAAQRNRKQDGSEKRPNFKEDLG